MKQLILIDACNVLHDLPEFKDRLHEGMDSLAHELLGLLQPLHDLENWELHVVVDGKGPRIDQQHRDPSGTLSVLFSPEGQTADTLIESWLIRLGPEWKVRIVTGDRAILRTAIAQKAETYSTTELFHWLDRVQKRYARQQDQSLKKSSSEFGNRLEGLS
jgi:predicted RNA-binding protein with PIN domain